MIKRTLTAILSGVLIAHLTFANALDREDHDSTEKVLRIGVLAFRGAVVAKEMWLPTAAYLSNAIPEARFRIITLTNDNIRQAVREGEVDFIFTNSASYAELEANFGISRIATLKNRRPGGIYTRFGALIITRADRDDINSLIDIKGKTFMAVHKNAFGGWWMAWREFKNQEIDPYNDFARLDFVGFPQDKIITAVSTGKADAGTVRTDVLERMAASGKIDIAKFKVLNAKQSTGFPFAHSTMLYPEWPFSIVKHTSPELAQKVAVALLNMGPDSLPALAGKSGGWTVPLDYQPVHDLMKDLHVGPYKFLGEVTFLKVMQQYWQWIALTAILLIFLIGLSLYMTRLNRKLKISEQESLQQENRLRALYDVASIPGLSFDEQITEVLKVGCDLLGTEIGRVCEIDVENQKNIIRNVVAPASYNIKSGMKLPLEKTFCNVTFNEKKGVIVNHAGKSEWRNSPCYKFSKLETYIAAVIIVNGEKHGTINYSSLKPREIPFKETDMDLVKLMGRRVSVILERRMAQEEIINAKLIAEDASNAKSSFLANMSHEIRTPLTAIIGFGESLLDSQQNMEQRIGSIKTIIRSGKHLLQVINDILDLSKVEARKLDVEEIDFLLFPILAEIDSLVRKQAKDSGLEFTIQYNFPLPKMIKSEPLRLKQILINLLNNAIKFTEAGSVTLIVDCDREKEKLHFKVVDTGIGLSISQIEKIFNPFSQADISTSRRFGGTGLGLSLSKQLVERLGGSLTVESQEGRGSIFQFSMDVGDLSGRDFVTSMEEVLVDTSPKLSSPSLQKMSGSILLAEDNTDNQVLISMYLESMGADVTIVSNGQAAVEAARNKIYDLILMDMQMPIMDGLEAVSLLRSQDYDYPIAALTANAMKEDKERCLQMGCNDFITKPVNRGDLCEVVGKYLLKSEISDATESAKIVPLISIMLESEPDFMSILGGFVKNLGVSINELRQADQDKRWDDLKFIVHQIKGLGGGYGYPMMTDLAAKIEFQIVSKNYHEVSVLLDELYMLYERINVGIEGEGTSARQA